MDSNSEIMMKKLRWNALLAAANNKLLGGSAKTGRYAEVVQSSIELKGNKLSISDLRKRRMDEELRAPLTALNVSAQEELGSDFTDSIHGSPERAPPKDGPMKMVYTSRKKQKTSTGTTTPTPPLRSLGRRRVAVAPPPPTYESSSPTLKSEKLSSPEASMPVVEQAAELDNVQHVKRQLITTSHVEER